MQGRQGTVLETLQQVQQFLDDNGTILDTVNQSGARKRLDEIVAQIGTHAVAQVGGRRASIGETAKQHQLRLALRSDHMRSIAVIAGQKLREKPEFTDLRLPAWNLRGPALTAAARDMANAAEKYTDLFVQEGLPADFVAQLRTAADLLDQSMIARGQGKGQRAGATTGLVSETKRARANIRLLDSLVRPKLGINDQLLRQWEVASHIRRPRTPQSKTSGDPTPTSTPTATSTTTPPAPTPAAGATAVPAAAPAS